MTATALRVRARLLLRQDLPAPAERRAIRQAAGLSQGELAEAIGVTRQAVSHWEAGTRTPKGALLDRYVAAIRTLRDAA
ncbi:helix-turn-helix transcriptional regulator [Streptomyces sp. S1D4-11]|nr:helix-turn-helix transcriptional regulator [Streptomyces sp. S1D4-11]QIY95871.1 helix-turn-helix transcriptional regulator [Streptomyces sp. S1D4-11]